MSTPAPPASTPTTGGAPPAPASASATPVPHANVLIQAAKLAIAQDKPILLDYYVDTITGKAFMGEDKDTEEKMLVKSAEEFTSLIQKTYKVGDEYIVMTENSIYIVSGKLTKRRIQANSLRQE
jgi:hypothetical protein